MTILFRGKPVEVWEISKTNSQPDWVKEAFQKNIMRWLDNRVCILMAGLNPSLKHNLAVGVTGTIGGGFAGYGIYVCGYPGDIIDLTNHKVVSKSYFNKHYQVLEDK
ncbi:hypothetical protein [Streptococcus fryi]